MRKYIFDSKGHFVFFLFYILFSQILDSVDVEMSTCEVPRPPNGPSPIQASARFTSTYY